MITKNQSLRLAGKPFRIQEFIRKNAVNIAQRTFGEIFDSLSRGRGMSKRYQQSFYITRSGNELQLELDYKGDNDEPLGLWFERGTKRHFIKPTKKDRLSWVDQGTRYYSKGHFVSGITAKHIIRDTVKIGKPLFLQSLQTEIQNFSEKA